MCDVMFWGGGGQGVRENGVCASISKHKNQLKNKLKHYASAHRVRDGVLAEGALKPEKLAQHVDHQRAQRCPRDDAVSDLVLWFLVLCVDVFYCF